MKRFYCIALTLCFVWLVTACGARPTEIVSDTAGTEDAVTTSEAEDTTEEQIYVSQSILRIVDGAQTSQLVLAGKEPDEVYTLDVGDTPVYLDGKQADASALEDGMMVTVELYDANLPDSGTIPYVDCIFADSLGTEGNPGGGYYDLCGFYLQVLEDLWNADSGLNDGISYISVDLSQAPGGLTDGEKAAIAQIFAETHGAEGLTLTRAQLEAQGYLTDGAWDDGLLFTIEPHAADQAEAYSLPVLRFDASKWRSPLGAYFFTDCTAVWPELGAWDGYTVGGEAIS